MKKILLLIIVICTQNGLFAQNTSESKSTSVEFLNKDGLLLNKDFYPIGSAGNADYECLIMTDVVSGKKTGCLRIETSSYSSSSGTDTYIGTLDLDEIDACIKSLKYIQERMSGSTPEVYSETMYVTRDGVSFGCYVSSNKNGNVWSAYVKPKRYISRSSKSINIETIPIIIGFLEKGKEQITKLTN